MQLEQETIGQQHVLRPVGRLDGIGAPILESAIKRYLEEGGQHLILDFARLGYISSIGLRVVLMAGKKLLQSKGTIVLTALTPNVQEVFEMSGFISLFPVKDSLAAALAGTGIAGHSGSSSAVTV